MIWNKICVILFISTTIKCVKFIMSFLFLCRYFAVSSLQTICFCMQANVQSKRERAIKKVVAPLKNMILLPALSAVLLFAPHHFISLCSLYRWFWLLRLTETTIRILYFLVELRFTLWAVRYSHKSL